MDLTLFINKYYTEKGSTHFKRLANRFYSNFSKKKLTLNSSFQDYGLQGNTKVQEGIVHVK